MSSDSIHFKMSVPGTSQLCIALIFEQNRLAHLTFVKKQPVTSQHQRLSAKQYSIIQAIDNYFKHHHDLDSIPLFEKGTPFQKRVWKALRSIKSGEVITYGELAKKLDSGARAVANACRHNPIAIVTPCHRVVSSTGMGGYMGQTEGVFVEIKRMLLEHEHAL